MKHETSFETILRQIDEWTEYYLPNFKFRKHQREVIAGIIDKIVNEKNHNIIIEAPTGTGKSIINIISSQVLWEYYHIDSYILCSDLYLFDQYEKFVDQNPQLHYLASIKGMTGNYTCLLNKEDIRNCECAMCGLSWSKMMYAKGSERQELYTKGFRCMNICKYVKSRKKALSSPVVITTYQNLLYQLNIVYKGMQSDSDSSSNNTFGPKQVIFCDEAHNMPNIIQLKYTPEIRYGDLDKLTEIYKYYEEIRIHPNWYRFTKIKCDEETFDCVENFYKKYSLEHIKEIFEDTWKMLVTNNPPLDELAKCMEYYGGICTGIKYMTFIINAWISFHKKSRYDKLFEKMIKIWKTNVWLGNYVCTLADFINAVLSKNVGPQYILKQIHDTNLERKRSLFYETEPDHDQRVITLNCMKENYLVYCGLLSWAKYRVFTSATIGGYYNFCENNGIEYTEDQVASFDRVPTIFNYDKSPINFINRYSMSYREREESLPQICKFVQSICNKHKGQKGMIQTGSYKITKQVIDSLNTETKKRLLTYNGSHEKIAQAQVHKSSKDTILIGPSLNQGIDLPDDNVRFIIILKVPYPQITDPYVKEKIRLFPRWYDAVTATEIIQGIGRGVRNEKDWCETYILDSCFHKLYLSTMDQFSEELKDRIKIYT